jgi:hypothetical protein
MKRTPIPHDVTDFSDRETVPMDLLEPEPVIPRPQVIELFGDKGRSQYLEAVEKQKGRAGA